VLALEWRIREDVPINLKAVKLAAEKYATQRNAEVVNARDGQFPLPAPSPSSAVSSQLLSHQPGWGTDETLGIYINEHTSFKNPAK
jgi:hypothetical protein